MAAPIVTVRIGESSTGKSMYDLSILSQSLLNPNYPSTNGTLYNSWCIDMDQEIYAGNYSAHLYSSYELPTLQAAMPTLGTPNGFVSNLDSINWLLNWFNGSQAGITQYEVQAAIWKLMGDNWKTYQSILGGANESDVNNLYSQALAHNGFVPDAGQKIAIVADLFESHDGAVHHVQPQIIESKAAKLGDFVWKDSNGNGLQDTGETGIAGVKVELVRDVNHDGDFNDANEILARTTTDAQGHYDFKGLTPGFEYQVRFTRPTGYTDSPRQVDHNALSGRNSDGLVSNIVVLKPGEYNSTIDAGFVPVPAKASLGDYVWDDGNHNGRQDVGERSVAGVTVKLLSAAGAVLQTTTTDNSGKYLFKDLNPGQYKVQFIAPNGYEFTTQNAPVGDSVDSDANASGMTDVYTLVAGQNNLTVDAGIHCEEKKTASLGDRVWHDKNANGIQDADEQGVANAHVTLYKDGVQAGHMMTNAQGLYRFDNLAAGNYQVKFAAPDAYASAKISPINQGADDTKDSDADILTGKTGTIVLHEGESNMTIDAGMYLQASLGDRVWLDNNGNGLQDAGEVGMAGVNVRLHVVDPVTHQWVYNISSTKTNAAGNYLFTNLKAGSYAVAFDAPTGYSFTNQNQGTNDEIDSDPRVFGTQNGINIGTAYYELKYGEDARSVDAGLVRTQPASLGDRVWHDTNANGIQDAGEAGVANAHVSLFKDGVRVANMDTDAQGKYLFQNLQPGTYQVQFAAPDAYPNARFSPSNQGGNDAVDSDADVATGRTANITLQAGENNLTVDAGLYLTASLGDTIWADNNHNGIQDAANWGNWYYDYGLDGVKVNLINASGAQIAQTTTANGGKYLFENLQPGAYRIQIADGVSDYYGQKSHNGPIFSDWVTTVSNAGGNEVLDSDAVASGVSPLNAYSDWVTLRSGQNYRDLDMGVTPIVLDLNGDGIQTVSRANSNGTFDLLGNGKAINSGWISGNDGFLAIDNNGDGQISDINELFGGHNQGDGFAKLASFDSNADGVVDANDARFAELLIWRDANGDHQSDASELVRASELVSSLKVDFVAVPALDENGNLHLERSAATLTDGTVVDMTDVYFNVSAADAAAAGVVLPSMADLLSADGSLDSLLGGADEGVASGSVSNIADFDTSVLAGLRQLANAYDQAVVHA